MADVKHKVERAAFGAAIDGILKYVNKDEAAGKLYNQKGRRNHYRPD